MVKILQPRIQAKILFFVLFGMIPFAIILFFQNCSLLQRNERKIIEHAEEFVVYETEMPLDMRQKEEISFNPTPYLKKILSLSLKSITTSGSIFGPGTVPLIPPHISEKLTEILWLKIQEKMTGKLLQVVIRQDDKLAPQTRIFRTIFYFYPDKRGLNFIFLEAAQNINFGNQYSFSDWANPPPWESDSPLPTESSLTINEKSGLSYQIEDGMGEPCNPNDNNGEKKLYCRKIVFLPSALVPQKQSEASAEKSLIELKNLFEKKLINKTEYESKRKEILERL